MIKDNKQEDEFFDEQLVKTLKANQADITTILEVVQNEILEEITLVTPKEVVKDRKKSINFDEHRILI